MLFPGLRFHPPDVYLVMYYLNMKIMGKNKMLSFEVILEVE